MDNHFKGGLLMIKKGIALLVSITLSLFIFVLYSNNNQESVTQDETAIKQVVINDLQEQWNLLLDENSSFTSFDQTLPKINEFIIQEKSKVNRHYIEPAKRAGFKYTSVTVDPKIGSLTLDNMNASVELTAYIEYESKYTNSNDPIITKQVIPYSMELTKINGTWYVTDITYSDVYSKGQED